MSDPSVRHNSPVRPFLLVSNNAAATNTHLPVCPSDIEHTGDVRIPSGVVVVEQEPPRSELPNTNVTVRIATPEKSSVSRPCTILPCGGTLFKVVLFYGLVATGIGGYLLRQFFRIPSLQNEVNQLSKQVDRLRVEIVALHTEIETLTKEIDRLEELNGQLNSESLSLQQQVNITQGNLVTFNSTINQYEDLIANLTAQNILWKDSNSNLNHSIVDLSGLNTHLEKSILALNASVVEYETQQGLFIQEIYNLTNLTANLNQSVISLGNEVTLYQQENSRLQTFVSQLGLTIHSFDNTTLATLNLTMTANAALQQNIAINRNLLLERLNTEYRTLLTNWDCDILGRFALKNFVNDETLSIGSTSFPSVFNYLNTKVLGYLCINTTDFQAFMVNMILPPGSNVYDANLLYLKESVMRYANLLLQYYFPTNSQSTGLNSTDWEKANYQCFNLTSSQRFVYGTMISQYYPSSVTSCSVQAANICIY